MSIKNTLLLFLFLGFLSCEKSDKKTKNYLPSSGGTSNLLTIVSDDNVWKGETGDSIRKAFAAPIYGLPQAEPTFTLKQMRPKVFHEFVKKSRTFVEFKKDSVAGVKYVTDLYARPQLGVFITGKNLQEIQTVLKENSTEITKKIKQIELDYKTQEMSKNLLDIQEVSNLFNIDLTVLFSYRIAKTTENFAWLRKDVKNGDLNLLIYELPYGSIKKDSTSLNSVIKIRDSIGKSYIPGPLADSYMITEKNFLPFLSSTTIDKKTTLETRGVWDVKNDFMAGPFINYVIDDKLNNRQLVLEGFTYAPQIAKRDYMFELEAIIRSLHINKK
jgi:hypothetical protein